MSFHFLYVFAGPYFSKDKKQKHTSNDRSLRNNLFCKKITLEEGKFLDRSKTYV